jgi:hypothetical protein
MIDRTQLTEALPFSEWVLGYCVWCGQWIVDGHR